ncbi:MAG: ATP-grasp domain-containing protein [Balneolaceae bacterium]
MKKHICVVGIDEINRDMLNSFDGSGEYEYHSVLDVSEIQGRDNYSIRKLQEKAQSAIDSLPGKPDAVVGFWNFPVTCLVPLLARDNNLPGLPLPALVRCLHKYVSRKEQSEIIPVHTPEYNLVNPFSDDPFSDIELEFPFWLKPVVSFASYLGFKINNKAEFEKSIEIIKKNIHRFAEPVNELLNHESIPEPLKKIDGYHCVAERIIEGHQCTIEGYVHYGKTGFTGIFDSVRHLEKETFFSYEYPSSLDPAVIRRMKLITKKLMEAIGYDNSSFNTEFFYNEEDDHLWLLEINPRISQSHSDLFLKVDGAPNHKTMVEVALGLQPSFPHREGPCEVAGKFYYRHFEDGIVTRIPSDADFNSFRKEIPHMKVMNWVEQGSRLSELHDQDSYSYKIASIYLGGSNRDELYKQRDHVFYNMFNYEFDPVT